MKESLKNGFLSGLIATLCCLSPLLLIMLGVISASTALSFTVYNRYFIPLGIIILALTIWFSLKKRRHIICSGCTDKGQERKRIITFVISSLAVSVATYLVVYYKLLPILAPIVFDNFYKR